MLVYSSISSPLVCSGKPYITHGGKCAANKQKRAVLFGVFSKENELRVMKLCMLSLLDWFWFNRTRKRHAVHTQCSISLPSVPAAKTTTKLLAFFVPVTQKFTLPTCSMLTAALNDFSSWRSFLPEIYFLSTQPDLGSQP